MSRMVPVGLAAYCARRIPVELRAPRPLDAAARLEVQAMGCGTPNARQDQVSKAVAKHQALWPLLC